MSTRSTICLAETVRQWRLMKGGQLCFCFWCGVVVLFRLVMPLLDQATTCGARTVRTANPAPFEVLTTAFLHLFHSFSVSHLNSFPI